MRGAKCQQNRQNICRHFQTEPKKRSLLNRKLRPFYRGICPLFPPRLERNDRCSAQNSGPVFCLFSDSIERFFGVGLIDFRGSSWPIFEVGSADFSTRFVGKKQAFHIKNPAGFLLFFRSVRPIPAARFCRFSRVKSADFRGRFGRFFTTDFADFRVRFGGKNGRIFGLVFALFFHDFSGGFSVCFSREKTSGFSVSFFVFFFSIILRKFFCKIFSQKSARFSERFFVLFFSVGRRIFTVPFREQNRAIFRRFFRRFSGEFFVRFFRSLFLIKKKGVFSVFFSYSFLNVKIKFFRMLCITYGIFTFFAVFLRLFFVRFFERKKQAIFRRFFRPFFGRFFGSFFSRFRRAKYGRFSGAFSPLFCRRIRVDFASGFRLPENQAKFQLPFLHYFFQFFS